MAVPVGVGGGGSGCAAGATAGEERLGEMEPWPALQVDSAASEQSQQDDEEDEEPLTPTTVRRRVHSKEGSYRLLRTEPPPLENGDDTERYLSVSVFTEAKGLPPGISRVPSNHVLDGVPGCEPGLGVFCVMFHAIAGVAFMGRAYHFWIERSNGFCKFEAGLAALLSLLYIIVGVLMPCCVARLRDERPLRQILTIRSCYPDHKGEGITCFIWHARWLWRVATLLGLAAPILSILQVATDKPGDDGLYEKVFLSVAIIVCLTGWMLGLLLFGPGKLEEVALDAARVSVAGLIGELEKISVGCAENAPLRSGHDWATMQKKYVSLDRVLETLWSLNCIGGMWVMRVGTLFTCSVLFAAVGLKHPDIPTLWAFRVCGFILAVGGVVLLMRLAAFSGMCQGSALTETSLPAAVKKLAAHLPVPSRLERSTADSFAQLHDLTFFQNFLVLVLENRMGAQVFVTYELVASIGLKMCFYVPVVLPIICEWAFHSSGHTSAGGSSH